MPCLFCLQCHCRCFRDLCCRCAEPLLPVPLLAEPVVPVLPECPWRLLADPCSFRPYNAPCRCRVLDPVLPVLPLFDPAACCPVSDPVCPCRFWTAFGPRFRPCAARAAACGPRFRPCAARAAACSPVLDPVLPVLPLADPVSDPVLPVLPLADPVLPVLPLSNPCATRAAACRPRFRTCAIKINNILEFFIKCFEYVFIIANASFT